MTNPAAAPRSLPLPKALSLDGRRIAVTGAASGIGRATAKVAAELGLLKCKQD